MTIHSRLIAILLLCSATPLLAGSFVFTLIPADGVLSGPPGSTLGYGYTLTNPDPVLWLMTTNLSAGSFAFATATSLFDFPILAPGQTVTVPYSQALGTGLYEITIDPGAPDGFINTGAFVLSADFYDGDPLLDSGFNSPADDQVANYRVTSTASTSVPEPNAGWGFFAISALWFLRRVQKR